MVLSLDATTAVSLASAVVPVYCSFAASLQMLVAATMAGYRFVESSPAGV
jgi:hypothetical protein